MIITLKGADFSSNNIGTLKSWLVTYNLKNVTCDTSATTVERGAAFTATFVYDDSVIGEYNENSEITITMGETKIYPGDDSLVKFSLAGTSTAENIIYDGFVLTIPEVTGPLVITAKMYASDEVVEPDEPAVKYLLNLDFTKKSFADYISDGTLGSITGSLSTTHASEGDTFNSTDASYVALGNALTFPTNFEIQLRMKTSNYNHVAGCGIPLFTKANNRPWIFLRGDYVNNNYDNSFGLQSRLIASGGDVITIDDVTIPCNDNIFHDVIIHYEGDSVWMSVDGVKSNTVTSSRNSNTVTHMFGYSATYTANNTTLAYIRVVEL